MAMGVAIAMAMTDGDDDDDAMTMGWQFLTGRTLAHSDHLRSKGKTLAQCSDEQDGEKTR